MITAKQRVANGVEFLNRYCENWKSKINLETLDLSHPYHCIIGQIGWPEKDTYKGLNAVMNQGISEILGFLSSEDVGYDELQVEWIKVLT